MTRGLRYNVSTMKSGKIYSVCENEKKTIEKKLRKALEEHPEISFVYLHGSFVRREGFRDIDLAVYVSNGASPASVEYELRLEAELMRITGRYHVDVRVLNKAPLSCRYNVLREGILLFAREKEERAEFQEATVSAYFDFAPYRNLYLKETLGRGV